MDQVQVRKIKKNQTGSSFVWSNPPAKELKNIPGLINKLKAQKKSFKFVENGVEKTYIFNGNNYVVSLKSIE